MENRGGCNFYYYVIILLKSRVELGGKYFLESTLTSKIFGINHELRENIFGINPQQLLGEIFLGINPKYFGINP